MGSCCNKGLEPDNDSLVHRVHVKPTAQSSKTTPHMPTASAFQESTANDPPESQSADQQGCAAGETSQDYIDSFFAADNSSLGDLRDEAGKKVVVEGLVWRNDFGAEHASSCFALGHEGKDCTISPDMVCQGPLGDCYFVSSMAVLAERPALVRRLFVNSGVAGKVQVVLHRPWMEPRQVIIDNRLPCSADSQEPLFASCPSHCSWPGLLEKAWAKLHGSYAAIIEGSPGRALEALTGAPTRSLLLCRLSVDELWIKLTEARSSQHLLAATVPDEDQHNSGLVRKHAYSVLDLKTLSDEQGEHRLMQIRNPWGRAEWKGKWSDDCESWNVHPEEVTADLGLNDDGKFWMSVQDFHQHFEAVEINLCGAETQPPLSTSVRLTGRQAFIRVVLKQAVKEAYISLSGFDRSVKAAHKPEHRTALSLTVIGADGGEVVVGEFHELPHVWTRLPGHCEGEYSVLIERNIIDDTDHFPPERVVVSLHSNLPPSAVEFDELSPNEAGSHMFDARLHRALTSKCKLHGESHAHTQPSEQVTATEIGMGLALAKQLGGRCVSRRPILGCFVKLLRNVSSDCKAEIKVKLSSVENMRLVMPQPGKQMRVSNGLELLGCGPTGKSNLGSGGVLELTIPPGKSTALVLKAVAPGRVSFEWGFEGGARCALSIDRIAAECQENGQLQNMGNLEIRRIHLHGLYALQLTLNDSPEMVCDVVFEFKLDNLALDERNMRESQTLQGLIQGESKMPHCPVTSEQHSVRVQGGQSELIVMRCLDPYVRSGYVYQLQYLFRLAETATEQGKATEHWEYSQGDSTWHKHVHVAHAMRLVKLHTLDTSLHVIPHQALPGLNAELGERGDGISHKYKRFKTQLF